MYSITLSALVFAAIYFRIAQIDRLHAALEAATNKKISRVPSLKEIATGAKFFFAWEFGANDAFRDAVLFYPKMIVFWAFPGTKHPLLLVAFFAFGVFGLVFDLWQKFLNWRAARRPTAPA
jgi:hypothetical protein